MSIRTDVAPSEPAMIDAIVIRTEMLSRVDGAPASSGEGEHRRGCARPFGGCIGAFLTRVAERFVDQSGEECGCFGALTSWLVRVQGCLGGGTGMVGPPDMNEEADQDESDQEELVQQQVRRHDDVPSHDNERRRLYRMHPVTNYPFVAGTPPIVCATSRTRLAPASKVRL